MKGGSQGLGLGVVVACRHGARVSEVGHHHIAVATFDDGHTACLDVVEGNEFHTSEHFDPTAGEMIGEVAGSVRLVQVEAASHDIRGT